jgi:hypothetical protein
MNLRETSRKPISLNKWFLVTFGILILSFTAQSQTKQDFCKKWFLEGYIYYGFIVSPEEIERNDYLHFKKEGTFTSIDGGKMESGTWKWDSDKKTLLLYDQISTAPLTFQVISITTTELQLLFKDDENAIQLKFSTKK